MKNSQKSTWKRVTNPLLGENVAADSENGNCMTICRYNIQNATAVASHSHGYEQIVYVVKGEMNLTVGSEVIKMKAGDVQVIYGNVEHSAEIYGLPFETIEVYHPVRTDL